MSSMGFGKLKYSLWMQGIYCPCTLGSGGLKGWTWVSDSLVSCVQGGLDLLVEMTVRCQPVLRLGRLHHPLAVAEEKSKFDFLQWLEIFQGALVRSLIEVAKEQHSAALQEGGICKYSLGTWMCWKCEAPFGLWRFSARPGILHSVF